MNSKIPDDNVPVHVINIDIQDNHEEATIGAFLICELTGMVRDIIDCVIFCALHRSESNIRYKLIFIVGRC